MLPSMLRDIHRRFEAAFNSADVDGLLELYEPEAVLAAVAGEAPARGTVQIRAAIINFFAGGATITMETVAAMETGDIGFLQARWRLQGSGRDGTPFALEGTSAEVLRRQPDGGWRYVIDHPFAGA